MGVIGGPKVGDVLKLLSSTCEKVQRRNSTSIGTVPWQLRLMGDDVHHGSQINSFCFDFNGVFCLRKIRGFEFRCVCTLYSVPYSHREQPLSTSYAGIRQALSKATRARSSQNRRNLKAGIEMETT